MDALRSGLRRLAASARREGHEGRSVDLVDPVNVAASINTDRPGSVTTVSSRQTVVSENGTTRTRTTRTSRVDDRAEEREETNDRSS
jgi:hypothetical protein